MTGKLIARARGRRCGRVKGNPGRSLRRALIGTMVLGPLAGVASAQEPGEGTETIENVQLVFHLVQANGFADEDPEISDVVTELRELFCFRGYRLLSTSVLNIGLAASSRTSSAFTGSGSQRIVADDSATPLTIHAEVGTRRSASTVRAKVTLIDGAKSPDASYQGSAWEGVLRLDMPGPLLEASVTIRDGQRVVLGSTRRAAGEPVLILIVTPSINPT